MARPKNPRHSGRLYVFEGPESTQPRVQAQAFAEFLEKSGGRCEFHPYPGAVSGTLGQHLYQLRQNASAFGVRQLSLSSRHMLAVCGHLDALQSSILPALESGKDVVLGCYWWTTFLQAQGQGEAASFLKRLADLERGQWRLVRPTAMFLLGESAGTAGTAVSGDSGFTYARLAEQEKARCQVHSVMLGSSTAETVEKIIALLPEIRRREGRGKVAAVLEKVSAPKQPESSQLGFTFDGPIVSRPLETAAPPAPRAQAEHQLELHDEAAPAPEVTSPEPLPDIFVRMSPVRCSKVFRTYWKFAAKRQEAFFNRLKGSRPPWTDDPILRDYKFTNAYRASDRVSQYLIRNVIYSEGSQVPEEVFFRTLLFKLFNKIETWQLLEAQLGEISFASYRFEALDAVLTRAIESGARIYSAAYVMPAATQFSDVRKHRTHLRLLEHLLAKRLPQRMVEAKSMKDAFSLLRAYPMMGDFLAYQYVTDLNYSDAFDFGVSRESKETFVVPGPGARDGIRKCFEDLGGRSESGVIQLVADMQEQAFEALGIQFQTLWGRRLHLIDCQNLFCEVDKYARLVHPDVRGISGRTRIKQHFKPIAKPVSYWFPPKWGLNDRITAGRRAGTAAEVGEFGF